MTSKPHRSDRHEAAFALCTRDGQRIDIRDGRITTSAGTSVPIFQAGNGELRPGLINAHDHLFLNHFPRLGQPPYGNLYAWAEDVQGRFAADVRRYRSLEHIDALRFGVLKNLIGGVTAVVHHDTWSDEIASLPIRVVRVRVLHSLGFEPDLDAARDRDAHLADRPVAMHLAEGTDTCAYAEIAQAARIGLLNADTLAVHAVGASAEDIIILEDARVAVVWCPSSNLHLYGKTLSRELAQSRVDLLIGTDSMLSGQGTLLAELRIARETGHVDDATLLDAVGPAAARRLRIEQPRLEVGAPADVVLFRRPVLEATPADVALVIVDGRPRYGDAVLADIFEHAGVSTQAVTVGGVPRRVEAPLADVALRVLDLSPTCARIFEE